MATIMDGVILDEMRRMETTFLACCRMAGT
jgi:hypothetical protein